MSTDRLALTRVIDSRECFPLTVDNLVLTSEGPINLITQTPKEERLFLPSKSQGKGDNPHTSNVCARVRDTIYSETPYTRVKDTVQFSNLGAGVRETMHSSKLCQNCLSFKGVPSSLLGFLRGCFHPLFINLEGITPCPKVRNFHKT